MYNNLIFTLMLLLSYEWMWFKSITTLLKVLIGFFFFILSFPEVLLCIRTIHEVGFFFLPFIEMTRQLLILVG